MDGNMNEKTNHYCGNCRWSENDGTCVVFIERYIDYTSFDAQHTCVDWELMQKKYRRITHADVMLATKKSFQRMEEYLKLADELRVDPGEITRRKECKCRWCFYSPQRVSGFEPQNACGVCGVEWVSGHPLKTKICPACAINHTICVECGGRTEMRTFVLGLDNHP